MSGVIQRMRGESCVSNERRWSYKKCRQSDTVTNAVAQWHAIIRVVKLSQFYGTRFAYIKDQGALINVALPGRTWNINQQSFFRNDTFSLHWEVWLKKHLIPRHASQFDEVNATIQRLQVAVEKPTNNSSQPQVDWVRFHTERQLF